MNRRSTRESGVVWWPVVGAILLVVSSFFAQDPLVASLTGERVGGVELALPFAYLLFAPLGSVLDQLTLLTDRQHVAILVSLLALYLAWRVLHHALGRGGRGGRLRKIGVELAVASLALAGTIAFYAFGVLGSRPMAAIRALESDLAIVDFHSHTEASHDGRSGLDIGVRRAWHEGAGFDLVYVTDHGQLENALAAMEENPSRAGDGISLLPGMEVVFREQHVLVLGVADPRSELPNGDPWPVLIQTLPNDLSRVPVSDPDERRGVHAIELVDGDPRGLRQSIDERDRILSIADSLGLALVAGSNHHGWGTAAAAWTLMEIPGWRQMLPEEVGRRVEEGLRDDGRDATLVVERPRLPGGGDAVHPILAATTLPRFGWHVLTGLSLVERLAWFGWVLFGTVAWRMSRRSRRALPFEPTGS